MKKVLSLMMLAAAMLLPWASGVQAQSCTQSVTATQPFFESFEDVTATTYSTAGNLPACWNAFYNGTSDGYVPHVVGSGSYWYVHTGTKSLVMTSGGASYGSTKHVLLPPMNVPLNQLYLSFWMCTESNTNGVLTVGYVTSDDTTTFTPIQSFQASSETYRSETSGGMQTTGGHEYEVSLLSIPSTATRIAFRWSYGSSYFSCCIDDVTLAFPPTCPKPENFAVTDATPYSLSVSWTDPANAGSFLLTIDDGTTAVDHTCSATTYTFNNLDPATEYDITLQAICGAGDSSVFVSLSATTLCVPMTANNLPYFEGFETTEANTSYSTAGVVPVCWTAWSNGTAPGYVPHVVSGTGSYVYRKTGNNSLVLYPGAASGANGNTKYVMLPQVSEPLSNLYLNFWMCTESATNGYLELGYVTGSDTTGFTPILHIPASSQTVHSGNGLQPNNGMDVEMSLATVPSDATRLVFKWFYNGAYGCCIDDVLLDFPPACPTPAELVVTDSSAHTVDIEWTSSASEFIVEYGPQGFVKGTGDSLIVYNNSVTLENLLMGATYGVYVTAVCDNDTSTGSLYGTVHTGCATLTTDDLPYTEDFEAYGTGAANPINACWSKGVLGTTTNFPYPYSTAAINGSRGLYFYSVKTSSLEYCNWLALPPVDDDLDVNTLMVNFMVKRGSSASSTSTTTYSCRLLVGVADSVDGFTTGDIIDTTVTWVDTVDFSTGAASSIHSAEVSFANYTGTGKYIVFYAQAPDSLTSSNYNTVYVDDITLRLIPNCFWPSEVALDSISSDAAVISWTPDSRTTNPSYWEVEYGVSGFTPGEGTFLQVNDTSALLSDLVANTEYDVYIRANCGGDVSDPTAFTFRTACTAVPTASLPYIEDFETYTSGSANPISPCWTKKVMGTTTQYPYPYSTAAITGNIGLYFYGYYSATNPSSSYAALPMFESDLNDLMVSFYMKRHATATYHSTLQVGVMSDPNDFSTFELVETFDITDEPASSIHRMYASLEGYEGTGRYIAFYAPTPSSTYNYVSFDSLVVDLLPPCRWPVNLAVDSVDAYEIDLSWSGSSSSYEVQVSTTETFTPATTTSETVSSTSIALTGLSSYTQYYVRARGICGEEYSMWTSVMKVHTTRDCGPNSINVIDTIGHGTSSASTYAFYSSTSYPRAFSTSIFTAEELFDMGLLTNNRINGLSLHAGTTGGTINGAKIYMAETSLSEYSTPAWNDSIDRNTMTLVYSGDLTVTASQWIEIPFDTVFNYSGMNNLVISFVRDGSASAAATFYYTSTSPRYSTAYFYVTSTGTTYSTGTRSYSRPNVIFDVCTEIPSCMRPTNVVVQNYSDTSASIQWDSVAANYEVVVSTTSINPDSVTGLTTIPVSTNSIVLNSLTPNTDYYVYVRSSCGAIGNSEWSIEADFHTACAPQALPYSEDFESYASGSTNSISPCWVKGTSSSTAYPYPYSTNAVNGSRSLYFYGYHPSTTTSTPIYSYAALPMFQDSVKNLSLSFYVRRYATVTDYYTTRLVIGVMTNPHDINTFFPMDTLDLKTAPASSIHGYEFNFNNYTGDGRYIAIYDPVPPLYGSATYTYSYAYVDDIMVDYIASCPRPSNIVVNNITENSATVHWDASLYSGATFEVEYGLAGFTQGTGTTLTTSNDSIDIAGLAASANYDVYVRALCSATETSNWSFVQHFATECGFITLPLLVNFEGMSTGTTSPLPTCWTRTNNATGTYNYYPYIYNSSTYAHSGTNCLYFYNSTSSGYPSDQMIVFPPIDVTNYDIDAIELNFWARAGSYNNRKLILGVMTDPTVMSTFVPTDTVKITTALSEYTMNTVGYTGTGTYIALRMASDTNISYSIYVDDIALQRMSPCPRAYDLTAYDGTATSVTLEWADTNIGTTGWLVEYGLLNDTATTLVNVTSNPYTLTGLTPNTNYRYRVAPYCASGSLADWSREWHNFGTAYNPAAMPYSYDFENAAEWANWQTSSSSSVNWYRGTAAEGNTTNALYLSADNGATHSWNMNTRTNAVAYRDIDFGTTVGSYQIDFDAYMGGTYSANYDGISVVVTDPAIYVQSQDVNLISPWGNVNEVGLYTVRRDTVWGHHTVYIEGVSGVKRLAFYHFNQSTGTNYPYSDHPSAVDNVVITPQVCDRPYDLTVLNATTNSVTLHWTGVDTATYQVAYRVQGAAASTNVYTTVSGTTLSIAGLPAATNYYWWVRKICSLTATDTVVSGFSTSSNFATLCGVVSVADTLFEDFESYTPAAYNTMTDATLPNCWESYSEGGATVYPHVTDSGTYSYCVSGRQALTMTSATSNTSYGPNSYVRLIDITEPTNTLTVAFWMCTESSTLGELSVGYLTGTNYETDFVAVKTIPASASTVHSGNGIQTAGHGIFDTVSFEDVPAGNYPIAFRWHKESTFYSVCLDDIAVWSDHVCSAPTVTTSSTTFNTASISWNGNGTVEVGIVEGLWDASLITPIEVNTNSYTFDGLTPETQYVIGVRTVCDVNFYSEWVLTPVTTLELPCYTPTALNASNVTYEGATITWIAGDEETAWEVEVVSPAINYANVFEVSGIPTLSLTNLQAGVTYSVAVRSDCGLTYYSDWTDTVTFTTPECDQVTEVNAIEITANSVKISWTDMGATKYVVEYGNAGYSAGAGTQTIVENATQVVINGLDEQSFYDVYVSQFCTETLQSPWSPKLSFQTEAGVGIDQVENGNVALYPNPASTTVTVSGIEGEAMVTVVDMNGREVYTATANGSVTIDVNGYAKGAYFVRVTGERTTAIRKLIVK